MRFDLSKGFPLITTKKLHTKSIFIELLWFLRGDSNVRWLQEQGVSIWNEWADDQGDLDPVYGVQWRSWPTPNGDHNNQLTHVLDQIHTTPDTLSLNHSPWNVTEIPNLAIPLSHPFFLLLFASARTVVVSGRVW